MSTKITSRFIDTEIFGLHLYTDFAGSPAITIRIENKSATIHLSQHEHDEIKEKWDDQE